MARYYPWRHGCSDNVRDRIEKVQSARFFILHQTGPTGFHIKEEGKDKKHKVFLGDPHSCSCHSFLMDKELCIHILWVLVKKFKLDDKDPLVFQYGLIEREINNLIFQQILKPQDPFPPSDQSAMSPNSKLIHQKPITAGDVCPICQDALANTTELLTYCRRSCGNSLHIKCIKMWADHQKSLGESVIKCPLCREEFGSYENLEKDSIEAKKHSYKQSHRADIHNGYSCCRCQRDTITGICYRCSVCASYYLCESCYQTAHHNPSHSLQYRKFVNQKWLTVEQISTLPPGLVDHLQSRDLSSQDYDLLLELDSSKPDPNKGVAERILFKFPSHPIKHSSQLISQAKECPICHQLYVVGQWIRSLPNCSHIFHRDCIDYKLRYFQTVCPIDGIDVHPKRKKIAQNKSHFANPHQDTLLRKTEHKKGHLISGQLAGIGSLPSIYINQYDSMLISGVKIQEGNHLQQRDVSLTIEENIKAKRTHLRSIESKATRNRGKYINRTIQSGTLSLLNCTPLLQERNKVPTFPHITNAKSNPQISKQIFIHSNAVNSHHSSTYPANTPIREQFHKRHSFSNRKELSDFVVGINQFSLNPNTLILPSSSKPPSRVKTVTSTQANPRSRLSTNGLEIVSSPCKVREYL